MVLTSSSAWFSTCVSLCNVHSCDDAARTDHSGAEIHAAAIVVTNGACDARIVIREVGVSGGIRCIAVGYALLIGTRVNAVQQIAAIWIGCACIRLVGAWVILRARCTGIAIASSIARSAATAWAWFAGPTAIDVRFVAGELSVETVCRDITITRIAFANKMISPFDSTPPRFDVRLFCLLLSGRHRRVVIETTI